MLNLNIQNKMEDEGNMITNWLDKHGDPKIEKQVEKMLEAKEIERAAANLADPNICKTDNWIAGAQWQQERMYSEDEVLNFTQIILSQYIIGNTNIEQLDLLKETLHIFKNK